MNFLFWLCWMVNLLFLLFLIWGSGFRASFGASTDLNSWMTIAMIVIQVASLITRFSLKHRHISLIIVALPILVLFIMYLFDKKTK